MLNCIQTTSVALNYNPGQNYVVICSGRRAQRFFTLTPPPPPNNADTMTYISRHNIIERDIVLGGRQQHYLGGGERKIKEKIVNLTFYFKKLENSSCPHAGSFCPGLQV